MLLTASLQDRRVNYWEPLKYVARLRELHGDDGNNVLMLTDEHAGHFATSQADAQQREELQKLAFLVHAFSA
jgi:oligopeptidase B